VITLGEEALKGLKEGGYRRCHVKEKEMNQPENDGSQAAETVHIASRWSSGVVEANTGPRSEAHEKKKKWESEREAKRESDGEPNTKQVGKEVRASAKSPGNEVEVGSQAPAPPPRRYWAE